MVHSTVQSPSQIQANPSRRLGVQKVEATRLSHLKGNLGPNWDGPCKVTELIKPSTFRLESSKDFPLARPWNADNLKRFYLSLVFCYLK